MRIKRLKLCGFKSFVEPAELRIEPGLTGVVGPNGCGKSNLLEAIRWVMAESSPKSLRGGGMEDVIFAGTANRPPRGFAEVVLHAETRAVNGEREELEVVRRIERGAGSAYRLNGRDARAKDVALIFADAATGAHSPALVSQGRIAAIISAKPDQRRLMLEEAAGIAGLHVRRRDAEQKLRATEANLARIADIMAGLDRQIAVLRRQARSGERYTALSDRIRTAEARLVFARWRDAAAAADAAKAEAQAAEAGVAEAQELARLAQTAQAALAHDLAAAREDLADRRDDASAHGHRMAALSGQLQAAEERLSDLDRQRSVLEQDRADADRVTRDAADALVRLERDMAEGKARLAEDEARRPALATALDNAERASREGEVALAQATAAQAGVEAEWRVADAELAAAGARLGRVEQETARLDARRDVLLRECDPEAALLAATQRLDGAQRGLESAREAGAELQAKKAELQARHDDISGLCAATKGELAGIEREHAALLKDREARSRRNAGGSGLRTAIETVRAAPGYERALAAVLGRDAKAMVGGAAAGVDGHYWTGANPPQPVAGSLAAHMIELPAELAARLALVHVAEDDDGRELAPGEWLVTRGGRLRRWDGFVARGGGAAEAAILEAENRLAELAEVLPSRRAALAEAEAGLADALAELGAVRTAVVAADRALATAAEQERAALRARDQAEDARQRLAHRLAEIEAAAADVAEQRRQAQGEQEAAQARRTLLPDPAAGRAALQAAQVRHDAARHALQAASATLAAHEQALAVLRERSSAHRSESESWRSRAGTAASRLAEMDRRFAEIETERAITAAKPTALMRDIEEGSALGERIGADLDRAEARIAQVGEKAQAADDALSGAQEALALAREHRAGAAARAANEDERRIEMARISGERFQCPPSLLPGRFAFAEAETGHAGDESAQMDRLVAERERIGPVNLVAAEELAHAEAEHGANVADQAELAEAVNRLRGSIGNLNREGRDRLRSAFETVDGHFRRLFARLFEGGQAHLALVDSDDPLEAGLEIYAQPPGKRLQSLTLLSGGEQALTAVALIFALFLTNPAPICVLDEVDAPLDDANVERFCDLLDAMVAETETRYLIVTHNAVTMSRMHRLFGVTMVERGVSRLVSVDLGGAEQLLAAE